MGCIGLLNKIKVQGSRFKAKGERRKAKKLRWFPSSCLGTQIAKLELLAPNSQAPAWELAINFFKKAIDHVEVIKI
jgi:hypothetical protein